MNISEELKALKIVEAKLICDNPLNSEECIKDYKLEGKVKILSENNFLILNNILIKNIKYIAIYTIDYEGYQYIV